MSEGKETRKRSILFSLVFIIFLVVVVTSAVFTGLLVHYRTKDLIEKEDTRLFTAAELMQEMLGPFYHDRITDAGSVSEEEFRRIVMTNDEICRRLKLQYLWSVLVVGDRIVFTSATHSDLNDPASNCAAFFETHRDPQSFAPALKSGLQPTFSTFKNEWGQGRQVLIPRKDSLGRTFIYGASVQLTDFDVLVRRTTLVSVGIGLSIICFAILLAWKLAWSFSVPITRLTDAARRMASGDFDVPLEPARTREVDSLSHSLDQMRQGTRRQLSDLRRSEELLMATFSATADGILVVDKEGRISHANAQFARMWGIPRDLLKAGGDEKALGFVLDQLADPEGFQSKVRELYQSSREDLDEVRLKDGRIFERFTCPVVSDGEEVGRIWDFRDITERKLAEESLKESERRVSDIIEFLPDATLAIDSEKRVIVWNRAIERMTGISAGDMLGKGDHEYTIPFYGERRFQLMDLIWEQDGDVAARYPSLRREGETLIAETFCNALYGGRGAYVFVIASPLHDREGNIVGAIESIRDITERKLAEADNLKLASAIDQAVECVVITDPHGGIQYVNPAFERITGYARDEVIGRNPSILKSGAQDEPFYKALWETIARGGTWTGRLVNRRKNGALYQEEASISPIRDKAGNIVNYVAVKRDVTKEVELEAQLLQSQKMEAIGQLAGGVAHDLNNLLTPILGYAEILLEGMLPGDPRRGELLQIQQAAESAKTLTRQLLAFSRKQVMEMKPVNLIKVLSDFRKILRRTIREDIDLRVDSDAAVGLVRADVGQVEQIIMNLAVNAQDAMPTGGVLTLGARGVIAGDAFFAAHPEAMPDRYVLLEVRDTGKGMDSELLEHIFEPFFTTKDKSKGTGLGLSTVYGIVQQHSGLIDVSSDPGQGTAFRIYLPRIMEEPGQGEERTEIAGATEEPGGTETILVVEDNDQVRDLVSSILRKRGYVVITARDGKECVDILADHAEHIDLLLTDVIMPDMNGRELYEELSKSRTDLPVVYMSGYTEDAITRHGVLENGVDLIRKPFTRQSLTEKVREVLDRKG